MERFIPESLSINGVAGDGKLEACRKIGGKYRRQRSINEGEVQNFAKADRNKR